MISVSKTLILDTGPLVAYLDASEKHHEWATAVLAQTYGRIVTCEAVVAEAWHLLRRIPIGRQAVLELLSQKLLEIDFDLSAEIRTVQQLAVRYKNVPMSLADACLVRMSEIHNAPICTLDSDFKIYRRFTRRQIEVVSPQA
jgi:uncharacterized protein